MDPECTDGTKPRLITGKVALIVTLSDGTYDSVTFTARIEGCAFDSISFSGVVTEHEYFMAANPQPWVYDLIVGQAYDTCPLECSLIPVKPASLPAFV